MERITKQDLRGMLARATRAARVCGAIRPGEELATYVPWSHAVIVVRNCDGTGGVSAVTGDGGTTRELYVQAYTLAVAWDMAGRNVPADIAAWKANGGR